MSVICDSGRQNMFSTRFLSALPIHSAYILFFAFYMNYIDGLGYND